jgi:uncharacterized protein (TIGR00369 family)
VSSTPAQAPSEWPERLRAAREAGDPGALLACIPYAQFLGVRAAIVDGELRCTMGFAEHLVGDSSIPALHGGTTGALLESAAIFTVMWAIDTVHVETVRMPKTINVTVDYLRSGRAKDTFAAATVTRQGRRVVSVRSSAWQDDRDKPIATAEVHVLLR